jgi:maleate isomerase
MLPSPVSDARVRLGVLTPSSNTTLEPITSSIAADAGGVTAHFARFPVTRISLEATALHQFDSEPIVAAAALLAHARVDVVLWSGTSAGWLGFDSDRDLVREITAATSIPATTSVLGLNDALAAVGARSIGLLTPYTEDVHSRIVAHYASAGVETVAGRYLGIAENFAFADIPPATISAGLQDLGQARPDALVTFCTNMAAAALAVEVEAAVGIPVFDTVTTGVWKSLQLAGRESSMLAARWGSIFASR